MSHILLSLFSFNYHRRTCRCMLQHLGEHCIKWWKGTNSNCVDEGREVCIIDPALQVTKPEIKESIKDILHGLLNNMSLKKPVRMNIRHRHLWKDFKQAQQNLLWGGYDHVKIVFIRELTIDNEKQGESASQVCPFVSLIN